jgi:hypothetical protein
MYTNKHGMEFDGKPQGRGTFKRTDKTDLTDFD